MKKIIEFLVAVLLISIIHLNPQVVRAEGNVVDSGSAGENITWTLYEDGLLEFTGSGAMYNYGGWGGSSLRVSEYREQITNVIKLRH